MVDVRRAYRRWFWRRMSWMLPGLCVAVTVAARLAVLQNLELWLRLPALVISSGVVLLFVGLGLLPVFVLCAKSEGDVRRAQSLRREFRSYPGLALASLSLSLILLAVPLLFAPTSTSPSKSFTAAGYRSHGQPSVMPEPVAVARPEVVKAPEPPPPAPPLAAPAPAPQAEAPPPATEAPAPLNPLPPPLGPVASPPAELPSGQELFPLRFRPDGVDGSFSTSSLALKRLDRPGLPGEEDPESMQAAEFELDLTILPGSRGWHGAIYEGAVDLPVGRYDSLRVGFFLGSLSDEQGDLDLEATVVWQRATVQYERRLAGYTRHSTFDLALRVGASVDRVITHEASLTVDGTPRPAPWIGFETAIWEQDGLGLVVQAGHSFALRLDSAAMSSTELKVELRIDVTESFSLEIGWHYTGVRIHDKGSSGGIAYQDLEQSFSGPVGGLNVRF